MWSVFEVLAQGAPVTVDQVRDIVEDAVGEPWIVPLGIAILGALTSLTVAVVSHKHAKEREIDAADERDRELRRAELRSLYSRLIKAFQEVGIPLKFTSAHFDMLAPISAEARLSASVDVFREARALKDAIQNRRLEDAAKHFSALTNMMRDELGVKGEMPVTRITETLD